MELTLHLYSRGMRDEPEIFKQSSSLGKSHKNKYFICDNKVVKITDLILSKYSVVFWLVMLVGLMCNLKSGPKYSK